MYSINSILYTCPTSLYHNSGCNLSGWFLFCCISSSQRIISLSSSFSSVSVSESSSFFSLLDPQHPPTKINICSIGPKVFSSPPETKQARTHPKVKLVNAEVPLNHSPKTLGVHLDTTINFNVPCEQVATRIKKQNNILKALAGTTWGQQKKTLLMTNKATSGLMMRSLTMIPLYGARSPVTQSLK